MNCKVIDFEEGKRRVLLRRQGIDPDELEAERELEQLRATVRHEQLFPTRPPSPMYSWPVEEE